MDSSTTETDAVSAAPLGRRFAPLAREAMNERQIEIAEQFLGFSLNGMRGAFIMMLRSPEAAVRFQELGHYLRFDTGIDDRLIELAVLVHARLWHDQYEWQVHSKRAADCGVPPAAIEAIRLGQAPPGLQPDEQIIFNFTLELGRTRRVSDETFDAALGLLGPTGVTDFTFLLGHYGTISMLLTVSQEGQDLQGLPPCPNPFADGAAGRPDLGS